MAIREAQPGRVTSPAELERMGLVAAPERFTPLFPARPLSRGTDKWPNYAMCLDKAPPNRDGSGSDRSRADYVWCMIAFSWGDGTDDTAAHLIRESRKAREDGRGYALQTARQAAGAVERRRQEGLLRDHAAESRRR